MPVRSSGRLGKPFGRGPFSGPAFIETPPVAAPETDVPSGPLSFYDLLDWVAESFANDEALGPVFGDGPEVIGLLAEDTTEEIVTESLALDEAIGPVFGDGSEIVALDAQDLTEEIVTEGAIDDGALFTSAVETDAPTGPLSFYDLGDFVSASLAEPTLVDPAAAADIAELLLAPDTVDEPELILGVRLSIPSGAPDVNDAETIVTLQAEDTSEEIVTESFADDAALIPPPVLDAEAIVTLQAEDTSEEIITESFTDDAALAPAPVVETDAPTGPLSFLDLSDLVTQSLSESVLIEPAPIVVEQPPQPPQNNPAGGVWRRPGARYRGITLKRKRLLTELEKLEAAVSRLIELPEGGPQLYTPLELPQRDFVAEARQLVIELEIAAAEARAQREAKEARAYAEMVARAEAAQRQLEEEEEMAALLLISLH